MRKACATLHGFSPDTALPLGPSPDKIMGLPQGRPHCKSDFAWRPPASPCAELLPECGDSRCSLSMAQRSWRPREWTGDRGRPILFAGEFAVRVPNPACCCSNDPYLADSMLLRYSQVDDGLAEGFHTSYGLALQAPPRTRSRHALLLEQAMTAEIRGA